MAATDETPPDLELELAEGANRRVKQGDAALASRDELIARTLEAGTPVAEVARRLGMTEQAIYQIRDRLERGAPDATPTASTKRALEELTDDRAFELASMQLLADLDPSARHLGGPGDRARDGSAGTSGPGGEEVIVMVSLASKWSTKVRKELERIAREGWSPVEVWAVTNRRTTPGPRDTLVQAAAERGWTLRVFDQTWLAGRLLAAEHLQLREELLGLAPPRPPAFLNAEEYASHLSRRASDWPPFVGREHETKALAAALASSQLVIVSGPGGVGKTRLLVELARGRAERWVFIEHHFPFDASAINEVAGGDELVAVIDNAHRHEDLAALVALLDRRVGPLQVVLISRPGFEEQLLEAVAQSRVGAAAKQTTVPVRPLSPEATAELLRGEPLSLAYDGAVEAIVRLCEGNPQIAILAAELAKGGTPVEAMGQNELLQGHVASLLASAAGLGAQPERRVVREVLALVAAVELVRRSDEQLLASIAQLAELGVRGLLRVLADLADAGLLGERNGGYFVTPDLLAEHVLWAAFFSSQWPATIEYGEVWDALSGSHLEQLVRALGRLPAGSAVEQQPAFSKPRAALLAQMRAADGERVGGVLGLARDLARGAPTLAIEMVDIGLVRLPAAGADRDQALTRACEATERVGAIDSGWPRQLAIAAAAYALPTADATRSTVGKALGSTYQRVPVNTSDADGALLAAVQRTLARLTREYWQKNREHPGAAEATAIASRTLLTVVFESHFTPAENPQSIVMRSHALPGSSHLEDALMAGAELFSETFAAIPPALQLKQLETLAGLRRTEQGFPGPFNIRPSEDTRALVVQALRHIEQGLTELSPRLSLPVRAEVSDVLETVPDEELSEYILVAHPHRLRRRGEHWEESHQRHVADAETALRLLHEASSARERLDLWGSWREEARQVTGQASTSPVLGMALERAAIADPAGASEWLRHLIEAESALLGVAVPALAVVFRDASDGLRLAEEWAAHPRAGVRALVAMAVPGTPGERPLLERLAEDDEVTVRDAVLTSVRYAPQLEEWRIDTALRAARSEDTSGLHLVLSLLDRGDGVSDRRVPLTAKQVAGAREIALATAAQQELHNAYELSSSFEQLAGYVPNIAREWIAARIDRLETLDEEARDGGEVAALMRTSPMPPEVIAHFAQHVREEDVGALLDRYDAAAVGGFAFGDLASVIAAVDCGSALVTARMCVWVARDEDGDSYRVAKLLESTVTWEQFTDRARELVSHGTTSVLVRDLIFAREPMSWSGSRVPQLQAAKQQYAGWCGDSSGELACVGRAAVDTYEQLIEREREREAGEADGWKWLRPSPSY